MNNSAAPRCAVRKQGAWLAVKHLEGVLEGVATSGDGRHRSRIWGKHWHVGGEVDGWMLNYSQRGLGEGAEDGASRRGLAVRSRAFERPPSGAAGQRVCGHYDRSTCTGPSIVRCQERVCAEAFSHWFKEKKIPAWF